MVSPAVSTASNMASQPVDAVPNEDDSSWRWAYTINIGKSPDASFSDLKTSVNPLTK